MILNGSVEGWGRFWKRICSKPNFKDKTVVDYGCGQGYDTLEILRAGAKKVIALRWFSLKILLCGRDEH